MKPARSASVFRPGPLVLAALLVAPAAMAVERPYFNDQRVPETRQDLENIQKALIGSLSRARQATVCIDLDEGSGSGVIVSPDGLVLTAAHVSGGVGKELTIVMEDGRKLKGESLGLMADTDAAMVRIQEDGPFPYVEIDRDESVRLGDWVFSLGHSGGFDRERGSVVRLGRLVRIANSTFQSDCQLIGGDSGGPLFDVNGRLIGIHSRVGNVLDQSMHVPVKEFLRNWDALLAKEFLGEGPFASLPKKGSGFLGVGTEWTGDGGLRITKVGKKTAAEEAGLQIGDVLLRLDEEEILDKAHFKALLDERAPGDTLALEFQRGGEVLTVEAKLGKR